MVSYRSAKEYVQLAEFPRPESGLVFTSPDVELPVTLSGLAAWQSNGGPNRGHPARALPFTLNLDTKEAKGSLTRIYIYGIFALWAGEEHESPRTLGAQVTVGDEFRIELLNSRHYLDALKERDDERMLGDGTSIRQVGFIDFNGEKYRVDELTIDLPESLTHRQIKFRDLGSPASFVIFDIAVEYALVGGCPFHSNNEGVALSELGSILRVGDRVKFQQSLRQLESALVQTQDLDEARGEALTFIAVVTAATLEMGAPRNMHRVQLTAARKFDQLDSVTEIAKEAVAIIQDITANLIKEPRNETEMLMNKAISIIDRNYAKDLTDESIAELVGLSTSHFRFHFKKATGQPFHKYLVAVRLERAKQMLTEENVSVSQIAHQVGFSSISHFSRAFSGRFGFSPNSIRRGA